MGLRARVGALSVAIACLALPAAAEGAAYTLNFDSTAPGTVVGSGPGGVVLQGNPQVFSAGASAFSPPNALRRPGNCPNSGSQCTTGDHQLEIQFPNPARTVSLRAGIPATLPCGSEFGCWARMVGFDAATPPNVVAINQGGWIQLGQSMTAQFNLDAGSHVIARAVYSVDEDPQTGISFYSGAPEETAQVDQLTYNVLESGETPPPPTPVAPPTVTITDPPEDQEFATTDVAVNGSYVAPAGAVDACVAANSPTPPTEFPADCRQVPSFGDGAFSSFRVPGMRPGANEIRVWFRDTRGQVGSDAVDVSVADGDLDFAISTMEVTQAVQTEALPVPGRTGPCRATADSPCLMDTYDGVPLAQDKRTIVRVFGEARGAAGAVRGTPAVLHGFRRPGMTELPGSPLLPVGNPDPIEPTGDLAEQRASPGGSWNFVLPAEWTRPRGGELVLVGGIAPSSIASPAGDCCVGNNYVGLQGISFTEQRPVTVYPVALPRTDAAGATLTPPTPLGPYFDEMREIFPAPTRISPPLRPVDVTDLMDDEDPLGSMNARLFDTFRDFELEGKVAGLVFDAGGGKGPGPTSVTSPYTAGLDFIAHEVGHSIGFRHAHSPDTRDFSCAAADLADRGKINGVGLNPAYWSGGAVGRFQPIGEEEAGVFDATPDAPANVYDYMSYCSNEGIGETWVSTGYWASQVREFAPGGSLIVDYGSGCCFLGAASDPTVRSRRGGGGGAQPVLRFSAIIGAGGTDLVSVETGRGAPDPAVPGSDVEVVVRDGQGAEVSRTPVAALPTEERPAPGFPESPESRLVSADVPGFGAASVEIVVGGTVVASRAASPTAPNVRVSAPGNGARISSKQKVDVRWNATDADGDPLASRVEFSADGGRTWKPLGVAIAGERLSVRGAELPRARNGQLRVTVGDGFNAASDVVTGLRTEGAKPEVEITSPPTGTRMRGDTMIVLEGSAFDDAGEPLTGNRLTWSSGKSKLGRGESVDVHAHELGRTVKLVARDGSGRTGADTIRVRVEKVAPVLTTLEAKPLGAKAKAISLRVAASLPARLAISGKGLRKTAEELGSRVETVKVGIAGKARDEYSPKLRLTAAGKSSSVVFPVARGG